MTDFLDALERELARAAQRRSSPRRSASGLLRRRWVGLLVDLRAVGTGAMMVGSVGTVVLVVAVLMVFGRPSARLRGRASLGNVAARSASRGPCGSGVDERPAVSDAAPGRDIRRLLSADASTTVGAQHVAMRELDARAGQATLVYSRYIRTARVPGAGRVTLLPGRTCREAGRSDATEPLLLAEVRSRRGVATIALGTPSQIHSGAAFRAVMVFVRSGHGLQFVSMVPDGVVSVICRHVGSRAGARRFEVVDHLVVMPQPAARVNCDLVRA